MAVIVTCPGPLIWFDVQAEPERGMQLSAVLECSACGYIVVAGNFHNDAHYNTPLMREGLSA